MNERDLPTCADPRAWSVSLSDTTIAQLEPRGGREEARDRGARLEERGLLPLSDSDCWPGSLAGPSAPRPLASEEGKIDLDLPGLQIKVLQLLRAQVVATDPGEEASPARARCAAPTTRRLIRRELRRALRRRGFEAPLVRVCFLPALLSLMALLLLV